MDKMRSKGRQEYEGEESGGKRRHCPLRRRVVRELTGEWTKYLVIALSLLLTIGFVSGMYVANGSMLQSAEEGEERYRLEDGHFELKEEADRALLTAMESGEKADLLTYCREKARDAADCKLEEEAAANFPGAAGEEENEVYQELLETARGEAYEKAEEAAKEQYKDLEERFGLDDPDTAARPVTVYENYYREGSEVREHAGGDTAATEGTIRVYPLREEIDLPCVMEGTLPTGENEIAIDRMHADNVGLTVGEVLTVDGERYVISGLVANADYSTLFESNTEVMFDAINFDVGLLTQEGFERLSAAVHYNYSFLYTTEAGNGVVERADGDVQEKSWSDAFTKVLATQALAADNELEGYLPAYANQAIRFTQDDIGSDKAMGGVLLYVLVAVLAFVFAITIGNTIQKEASVIGTLRALGYTRGELLRHYMAAPILVTLAAAVIGNLLGYTVFKDIVVGMYYNSYSLPSYVTVTSSEALIKTTVVPLILMFLINGFVLHRKLWAEPLRFLRHDLKRSRRRKAMRLSRWRFLSRFRLRVLFQNLPGYGILFLGILFVMLLLAMAIGMPDTLAYYKSRASELMLSDYQTILTTWKDEGGEMLQTTAKGAEPIGVKRLLLKTKDNEESLTVYGMTEGSRYVPLPEMAAGEALVSSAYADKYGTEAGDTPLILMFLINGFVLHRKLWAEPLRFLRHDLKRSRRRKAMRLSRWRFLSRFRLRVLFQNLPGYGILFLGILFVMLLLAMAIGMPDTLAYYKSRASELMLSDYQTILTTWKDEGGEMLQTTAKGAEPIGVKRLLLKTKDNEESLTVYGMTEGSRYVPLPEMAAGEALVSSAYADKYGTEAGDTIELDAQYENASYAFKVIGIREYDGGVAAFLPMDAFRETFDLEEGAFSGFLSEEEITDLPSGYIASVITPEDVTKMADQMDHSMGSYMLYFQYLCAVLAAVLMYLLTKLIIEANENAISMTKILGYQTREIASVYLVATTWAVILEEILGALIGVLLMRYIWRAMMLRMEGWFDFVMEPVGFVKMLAFVFAAYLLVTALDFRRIRRVPMDLALKNAE